MLLYTFISILCYDNSKVFKQWEEVFNNAIAMHILDNSFYPENYSTIMHVHVNLLCWYSHPHRSAFVSWQAFEKKRGCPSVNSMWFIKMMIGEMVIFLDSCGSFPSKEWHSDSFLLSSDGRAYFETGASLLWPVMSHTSTFDRPFSFALVMVV